MHNMLSTRVPNADAALSRPSLLIQTHKVPCSVCVTIIAFPLGQKCGPCKYVNADAVPLLAQLCIPSEHRTDSIYGGGC